MNFSTITLLIQTDPRGLPRLPFKYELAAFILVGVTVVIIGYFAQRREDKEQNENLQKLKKKYEKRKRMEHTQDFLNKLEMSKDKNLIVQKEFKNYQGEIQKVETYQNNLLNGPSIEYHEGYCGKMIRDDRPFALLKQEINGHFGWTPGLTSQIEFRGRYKKGKMDGHFEKKHSYVFWKKDPNPEGNSKTVKRECNYLDGKLNGIYEEFDSLGRLIIRKNFKNGLEDGDFVAYEYLYLDDEQESFGEIGIDYKWNAFKCTGWYRMNELSSFINYYNEDGKLISIDSYKDGKIIQTWDEFSNPSIDDFNPFDLV